MLSLRTHFLSLYFRFYNQLNRNDEFLFWHVCDTYEVGWIHDAIFNRMCAVNSIFQSRFLLLTPTCPYSLTSTFGRNLGRLLHRRFLHLIHQCTTYCQHHTNQRQCISHKKRADYNHRLVTEILTFTDCNSKLQLSDTDIVLCSNMMQQ